MFAISGAVEVQARKLAGLQGTVFRWLGNASAWPRRDTARAWRRLAVTARMIVGERAAHSSADRRPPRVAGW